MAYQNIVLSGYTLPYNPPEQTTQDVRSVVRTHTLGGVVTTEWPQYAGDGTRILKWPLMEKSVYDVLAGFRATPGRLSYVDEYGASLQVRVVRCQFESRVGGSSDMVSNVEVELWVAS